MTKTSLCLLALWTLAAVCQAAVPADEIKFLPGLRKQPFFQQWSGYLKASGTKKLHYWFIQSQSDSPEDDPVALWLNGGPGCSSDLGLLTENGPFRTQPDGMTLEYNPYSWNLVANMLYLEAPAGVGFSYSDDQNYTTSDDQVAMDNHLALKDFFSKYPEYAKNDFYVTGESYGGIYVPTLASRLIDDPDINLKGVAIGNGITDFTVNENSLVYFGYYHGLLGESLWNDLQKYCCNGTSAKCMFTETKTSECMDAIEGAQSIIQGSGLNIYNLYGECVTGSGLRFNEQDKTVIVSDIPWLFASLPSKQRMRKLRLELGPGRVTETPPCINATATVLYLNQTAVREALHIPSFVPQWSPCSSAVGAGYQTQYRTVAPQYQKMLAAKLKVIVYNGDVDMACNFLGDEWFVDSLGQKLLQPRMEWTYREEDKTTQVAGFYQDYGNLRFITVRGAGHMVPTDKPIPALKIIQNLILDQPL